MMEAGAGEGRPIVLFDEDGLGIQRVARHLADQGYAVAVHTDTEALLDELENGTLEPGLWVVGYALASGLRAPDFCEYVSTNYADVPCIVIAGDLPDEAVDDCFRARHQLLRAPVDFDELDRLVRSLIGPPGAAP